jgi:hypothetical protein
VEKCPLCKDQILDIFLLLHHEDLPKKSAFRQPPLPEDGKRDFRLIPGPVSRIAASFLVLALLAAFYLILNHPNMFEQKDHYPVQSHSSARASAAENQNRPDSQTSYQRRAKDNPVQKEIQGIRNPNFEVNPNLEIMINSQIRNEAITVLSPLNQSTHTGEILFSWKPFSNSPLQLKILNNKNEAIYQFHLRQSSFTLTEKLTPGLYYWKLESASDLFYVGKFLVNNRITPRAK